MTEVLDSVTRRIAAPAAMMALVGAGLAVAWPAAVVPPEGFLAGVLYGAGLGGLVVAGYLHFGGAETTPSPSPDRVAKADGGSTTTRIADTTAPMTGIEEGSNAEPAPFVEFEPATVVEPDPDPRVIPSVVPDDEGFEWVETTAS